MTPEPSCHCDAASTVVAWPVQHDGCMSDGDGAFDADRHEPWRNPPATEYHTRLARGRCVPDRAANHGDSWSFPASSAWSRTGTGQITVSPQTTS